MLHRIRPFIFNKSFETCCSICIVMVKICWFYYVYFNKSKQNSTFTVKIENVDYKINVSQEKNFASAQILSFSSTSDSKRAISVRTSPKCVTWLKKRKIWKQNNGIKGSECASKENCLNLEGNCSPLYGHYHQASNQK